MMTDSLIGREHWESQWFGLDIEQPADSRVLAFAMLGGVAFDIGVHAGFVTVGGWLAAAVVAGGLVACGRLRTTASQTCVVAALFMASLLMVRVSPWLAPFNVVAVAGLLTLAAMLARDGRLSDLPIALLCAGGLTAVGHALAAPAFLADPLRRWSAAGDSARRWRWLAGVVRGLAVAVPVVFVLGALLASADTIFASALRIRISLPENAGAHITLLAVGAVGVAGLLRLASARPTAALPEVSWRLGLIEWTTVLSGVVALFAAFAVVQVVAIRGGGRHVLETEGLTYAEYARSGYFQLLAVAVLTGFVLGALGVVAQRSGPSDRRRWIVLSELTVGLTFVVLIVALRRIGLYEQAYGWTMLRLMAKAGAVWIGLVLVLLAMRLGGLRHDRAWFVPASIAAGLAVLVALNLANPEGAVVRHNLGRSGVDLDPHYLAGLSDDAVPALLGGLDRMPVELRQEVLARVCAADVHDGLLGWNRATARADDLRRQRCAPQSEA
jgi:hypothetical protein